MKLKIRHFLYGFTGYSIIQLIGYLGISYTLLRQPMILLATVLILFSLVLGVAEWTKEQSKVNLRLTKAKILSCFSGSFTLIVIILFSLAIGVWIGI